MRIRVSSLLSGDWQVQTNRLSAKDCRHSLMRSETFKRKTKQENSEYKCSDNVFHLSFLVNQYDYVKLKITLKTAATKMFSFLTVEQQKACFCLLNASIFPGI